MTLTLASMQFSPRVIVSFTRDRITQWTLGIFLGTFLYCMAALPAAHARPTPFAPVMTVMGATLMVIRPSVCASCEPSATLRLRRKIQLSVRSSSSEGNKLSRGARRISVPRTFSPYSFASMLSKSSLLNRTRYLADSVALRS
jgi:hypothetical protein